MLTFFKAMQGWKTTVDISGVVHPNGPPFGGLSCSITIHTTPQSSSDERTTSTTKINDSLCLLTVRKVLENQGVRRDSAEIIMSAWREGTKRCYHTYIKKWIKHCGEQSTDPSQPTVDELIVFLTKLFHVGRVCMF